MLTVRYTTKFKKDLKTCSKRNYNLQLLENILDTLRIPKSLQKKNKEHFLSENYNYHKECHILSDWLLIYPIIDSELILYRTGTHEIYLVCN